MIVDYGQKMRLSDNVVLTCEFKYISCRTNRPLLHKQGRSITELGYRHVKYDHGYFVLYRDSRCDRAWGHSLIVSKNILKLWMSVASALASGLLQAAAFDLISEGTKNNTPLTIIGIVAGLTLITTSKKWLDKRDAPEVGDLARADVLKAIVIVGVMTIHSFPEGIAIGLSFGKGQSFGFLISLVLALHNIPEGLAIGLVLVPKGVRIWKAGLLSIFSSLPQPLMAVPAFLLVIVFEPFLPFGLGLSTSIWRCHANPIESASSYQR